MKKILWAISMLPVAAVVLCGGPAGAVPLVGDSSILPCSPSVSADQPTDAERVQLLRVMMRPNIAALDVNVRIQETNCKATVPTTDAIKKETDRELAEGNTIEIAERNAEKLLRKNRQREFVARIISQGDQYVEWIYQNDLDAFDLVSLKNVPSQTAFPEIYANNGPQGENSSSFSVNRSAKQAWRYGPKNRFSTRDYAMAGLPQDIRICGLFDETEFSLLKESVYFKGGSTPPAFGQAVKEAGGTYTLTRRVQWEGKAVDELTLNTSKDGISTVWRFESGNFGHLLYEGTSMAGKSLQESWYDHFQPVPGQTWEFPMHVRSQSYDLITGQADKAVETIFMRIAANEPVKPELFDMAAYIGADYTILDASQDPVKVLQEAIAPPQKTGQ